MENLENVFEKEKGVNVELTLHILRHGDRNLDGTLEEYGRERTREQAKKSRFSKEEFDAVKAFGSTAGPKANVEEKGVEMQRSLETAHIFGNEIAGDSMYETRPRDGLSYETLILEMPFDYLKFHEDAARTYIRDVLKSDKCFNDLSDAEKKEVSEYADTQSVRYLMNLESKDAINVRRETAGSFAVLIQRYVRMVQDKLNSNQKLLFLLGSHTAMIEPFLAEVVVWKDRDGNEKRGATFDEMGGNFKPSEGFDIVLKTDKNSKLEEVKIRFDDQSRLGGEVSMDMQKIDELASFYKQLHENNRSEDVVYRE